MPRGTAKSGAKAPAKTAARKAHAKSSKRHSKGSALKEVTKVAFEAVDALDLSVASKKRSSHHSRSPSMSPDDRPNPRFTCREHSPGPEDEAKARSFRSVDHVDHDAKTPERSESPADKAKGTPNAGGDKGGKPPKNLSLAEGIERAQAAKTGATEAKHSKKRMASRSSLHEGKETNPYYTTFDSSDEEEEGAI
ncbi:hypothetical protein L915_17361 [Phytophthora nicotianae]|uniref:Uncharacterized protein n=1 Tax=Phytophthora nicotianae TaxID=4792 RepID=W2G1K9_PHYNI|nr:hypothetical protein L915_17361 [Phytophthora nicotianae]ETL29609.1 hypothetical protein L916_17253 [Phytophthora nicotianae]